jgi:hypothetical protein
VRPIADAVTPQEVSIVVLAVLGSVLEGILAIVLFGQLLFPSARAIGIHDINYGTGMVMAMGIGLFAPPFSASATMQHAPLAACRPKRRCDVSGRICWRDWRR